MNLNPFRSSIMKNDAGTTKPVIPNFNLIHCQHTGRLDLGHGFDDRFLGGESSGQMQERGPSPRPGVGFFILGKHPAPKRLPAAREGATESGELYHVHPATHEM